MASLSEIVQLCRLCLVKDDVNIPIFDDLENARQISLKISSCLPVKVSIDDNLPKKICDGCSSKLDLCYEFWNSTAQAEKTLLSMVEQSENKVPETVVPQPILLKVEPSDEDQCEPPVPEPILVKTEEETDEPFAKRPRRSAAIKAQMQISPESDDDNGPGTIEDAAEVEDDIDDPDVDIDEVKPGPSGVNHKSGDSENNMLTENEIDLREKESHCKCLTCKQSFDDVHEIEFHQHQPTCKYFCERCHQQFDTKLAIVFHVVEHNMDEESEPEYKCEQCFLVFDNLDEYEQHQKSCLIETVSESELSILYRTESKDNPKISDSDNISEKINYYCKYCNKSFQSQTDLNTHLTTNLEGQIYGCNECGKYFEGKISLLYHLETHKRPNHDFKCNICGKSYSNKSYLALHMRAHTGERPFECTYCGKRFGFKSALNVHTRIHTGERPHKCKYCYKCFPQGHTLRTHMRIHSGEKPFKCTFCKKCFAYKSTLTDHLRTHTSENP